MAPFNGIFTARKEGAFSISYNVRETISGGPTKEIAMANLERNLDTYYTPQSLVMLDLMLNVDSFDEVVDILMDKPMTSPSHFIVGGIKDNEGVIISRDFDKTVDMRWLTDDDWYVVQTNSDVWRAPD